MAAASFQVRLRADVIDAAIQGAIDQARRNGADVDHPEVRRAFARLRAKLDQMTVTFHLALEGPR